MERESCGAGPEPVGEPMGGLYVHIPFCLKKCAYCDFYSLADRTRLPDFLKALEREILLTGENGFPCDTVYFGGGTPSLIPPEAIAGLLSVIRRSHRLREPAEITLEVNPGTVTEETLAGYRKAGVNRLSIGVQSFSDRNLSFLGRIHTAEQARALIPAAREAGFDNIGLDLIYGLPGQSEADWTEDLRQAWEYAPEHLSCYLLSYEPGTPLTARRDSGAFTVLPDGGAARLFRTTAAFLTDRGWEHYEISNFARRPCYRSRHNRKYWSFAPYCGLGPSAHSLRGKRRYWNHRDLERWLAALESGRLPVAAEEILNPRQQMMEAIFLGFRQARGIDLGEFEKRFGVGFGKRFGPAVESLDKTGLLVATADNCRLTTAGMLLLDSIVDRFVEMV
ncbi:MAG: radical SAM family heme chaperone HemW [Thermodesulfobacteriota bacterium]